MNIIKKNKELTTGSDSHFSVCIHVISFGFFIISISLLPCLADYYLLQPDEGFFHFLMHGIGEMYYDFEFSLVFLFTVSVLLFSKRIGVAICSSYLPTLLLAHASSIKYDARNELFRLDDLKLTEAAGIALHYLKFDFTYAHIFTIITALSVCICGIMCDKLCKKYQLPLPVKKNNRVFATIFRILAGCACLFMLFYYNYDFMKDQDDTQQTVDDNNSHTDRYVLYSFLKNDKYSSISIENIEESYNFFWEKTNKTDVDTSTDKEKYPTIIAIMNESWWNTDYISDSHIALSADPMSPFKELTKTCSSGYLSSNIFGGGTICSECEFLTGINTKYFATDAGISDELQNRKVPSLVDYFHALDYETIAIHPYYKEFYGRDKIYPNFGFDKMVFDSDMDYKDTYSRYISDDSLVKQIIKEYEDSTAKNKFIFSVSIASHVLYLDYKNEIDKNYNYPISVNVKNISLQETESRNLTNAINGIYLSNQAFAKLVSYFEKSDEPVILLMYGDHIPSFRENSLKAIGLNGYDYSTLKQQYSVPILMWSNCNKEKISFSGENINYLPQMLIKYAKLPETKMTRILTYERSILKSNTRKLVEDAEGNPVNNYNDEQIEAIRHFKVIDYDLLFNGSPKHPDLWIPE